MSDEPFHPGEHTLTVKKRGLFGGVVPAQVLQVSEAIMVFRTTKKLAFGAKLHLTLASDKHRDALEIDARVSKCDAVEGEFKVEAVVEQKKADHDTKIRAMRSWYTSDRYKVRESTRRFKKQP